MSGGKPSYSHVVTVSGSGKIVYTALSLPCTREGKVRAGLRAYDNNASGRTRGRLLRPWKRNPKPEACRVCGPLFQRPPGYRRTCNTENRTRAGAAAVMGYPHLGMIDLFKLLGELLVGLFRSRAAREAEMALRRGRST